MRYAAGMIESSLATVLRDRGDLDAAEPLLRAALAARERRWGRRHPDVAEFATYDITVSISIQ